MPRLVVVSNRVVDQRASGEASKGGLAMALGAALREHGGLWFGWSGRTVANPSPVATIDDGVPAIATIDLDAQDVDEYYNGFANRTLWPLCHYRMDLATYDRAFGAAYARVNARFAEALMPLLRPDDIIWVHDYHLISLARELRRLGATNRIGFFLHIPWPASQVIATLPKHHELVQAMFDYDLIGFQTEDWLRAFRRYVTDELAGRVSADGAICAFGRCIRAAAYPIGIDVAEMEALTRSDAARESHDALRATGGKMLIGVDRIDYTKGLPHKFAGYEEFLRRERDRHGDVFLLQIGQPSRTAVADYSDLFDQLQAEAGQINGAFGRIDWSPLRYRTQSMPRDVLAGAYRAAHAALVTPLRDGMNLVAKEYVAAQDPDDPGVLILSRFAGAATQMREALLVNPYSREDIADAIRRALDMPRSERVARWKALSAGLHRDDLTAWRRSFLRDLDGATDAAAGGALSAERRSGQIARQSISSAAPAVVAVHGGDVMIANENTNTG